MKLYKINKEYFSIPNIQNSYWAGFIAADGCLWSRGDAVEIGLQEKDKGHLETFARHVNYSGKIAKRKNAGSYESQQDAYRIICYGVQKWHDDLFKHFSLTPRKSLTLNAPSITDDLALAFIAGYIDGDGTVSIDHSRENGIRISILGTQELLSWIKVHIDKISNYTYNNIDQASPRKHRNVFQYQIRGKRAVDIFDAINKLDIPKMDRKWGKFVYATH